ncbi:MAG: metallophosphoesterase [Bdellovibrionales bacterium]|nr:metallophosphoesterase [Bdellovibrionales bacterium]
MKCIWLFYFLFFSSTQLFANTFSFIAIGDAPYTEPAGTNMFKKLIVQINNKNPDFVIHVGDIKGGADPCTNSYFLKVKELFNQFEMPLLYTPGDNEWTDCHRPTAGSMDPLDRLSFLRKTFFSSMSLGKKKIPLSTQSQNPKFKKYIENYYFAYKKGLVASLHLVGSNNNLRKDNEAAVKEYHERQMANLAWLEEIFKVAKKSNFLILFFHAETGWGETKPQYKGFQVILKQLEKYAKDWKIPTLMIHGDDHKFKIDHPISFIDEKTGLYSQRPNFTRLMVYGFPNVRGVEVTVTNDAVQPFSFKSLNQIEWEYKK